MQRLSCRLFLSFPPPPPRFCSCPIRATLPLRGNGKDCYAGYLLIDMSADNRTTTLGRHICFISPALVGISTDTCPSVEYRLICRRIYKSIRIRGSLLVNYNSYYMKKYLFIAVEGAVSHWAITVHHSTQALLGHSFPRHADRSLQIASAEVLSGNFEVSKAFFSLHLQNGSRSRSIQGW